MSTQTQLPDWDSLSFRLTHTDAIYRAAGDLGKNPVWSAGEFLPFADVSISPAAAVLSYGLGIFEGMKAERTKEGRILLFRPDRNAARFQDSARQLEMPPFPKEQFLESVDEIVRRNVRFIPPVDKGTLYIRPIQIASEPMLGLRRSLRFETLIYASPVGSYFKGKAKGLKLRLLKQGRVAPGGSGSAKAMGNYPPGIRLRMSWQEKGYNDVLFLDAHGLRDVTETSGSNFFALLKNGTLVTPPIDDQILPGITRASAIEIARDSLGITVEERPLPIEEVLSEATEVFCTGTAWTVRSVSEISSEERTTHFPQETLQKQILSELRDIQTGKKEDSRNWTREVRLP